MTEDELLTALNENGLARVADRLMAIAAPTVRVYFRPSAESAIPIGASKVGGYPDLPPDVPWPSRPGALRLVAQFNLGEVAPYDREGMLPTHGLLSFFEPDDVESDGDTQAGSDEGPWEWRALYYPSDPATFVRRDPPPPLDRLYIYGPCAVHYAAQFTLPDTDSPEVWPLELNEMERDALWTLNLDANHGAWEVGGHHLLGYPANLEGSSFRAFDREGQGGEAQGSRAGKRISNAGRTREIERDAARRWLLLLQLTSSDDAGFDWDGGGILHVGIERVALCARDFSHIRTKTEFL